jgi:hypothetical protein
MFRFLPVSTGSSGNFSHKKDILGSYRTQRRTTRVGILKQNAKSRYSGIPGFEVRRNSKIFYFAELFFKHCFIAALYTLYTVPE